MRRLLLAILMVTAAETPALACRCIPPLPPDQSRYVSRRVLQNAVAIVDGEVLTGFRPGGEGERVRVVRTLWGEAPAEFHLVRRTTNCDLRLILGQRKVLILSPAADGRYAIQSVCSDFLTHGRHLRVLLEEARRMEGERLAPASAASGAAAPAAAAARRLPHSGPRACR